MTGFVVLSRERQPPQDPVLVPRGAAATSTRPARSRSSRPGEYAANTSRGAARVSSYRYPDVLPGHAAFPVRLTGREIVYRVHIRRRIANFGVAVITRARGVHVEPRVVRGGDENRLAGYTASPVRPEPLPRGYGRHRLVAGVALPGPGVYDIVFDTPRGARSGAFRFRFWLGDVRPPSVRVLGVRSGFLELAVTDSGSGVDPVVAPGVGSTATSSPSRLRPAVRACLWRASPRGRHTLSFTVSDYQETKNMENVARILPNTRTVRTTFVRPLAANAGRSLRSSAAR